MKITNEQAGKFLPRSHPCAVCESENVVAISAVMALIEFRPKTGGMPGYPVVAAVCQDCGYIEFYSALALDIVKPTKGDALLN